MRDSLFDAQPWRKLLKSLSSFFVRIVPVVTITLLASTLMGVSAAKATTAHHAQKAGKAAVFLRVKPSKVKSQPARIHSLKKPYLIASAPERIMRFSSLKATDPTNTKASKNSRRARSEVSLEAWVASYTAQRVAYAESRDNCKSTGSNGKYRGKWQMDANFWATYGGLKFASHADLATCAQQDIVAYNGWISRHWQPWQTYTLEN
jgi:hypothetical protein